MVDLGASQNCLDDQGWMKFTYDTGAAVTAFPLNATVGEETEANGATYRTASGEIIEDRGGLKVSGSTEAHHPITLSGRRADVHKILVSAGRTHAKGHVAFLSKDGGWILPSTSNLTKKIEQIIEDHARKQKGAVPLYQEKGTYVGYVKVEPEVMRMQAAPQALCPVQPAFDPLPGGPRHPRRE